MGDDYMPVPPAARRQVRRIVTLDAFAGHPGVHYIGQLWEGPAPMIVGYRIVRESAVAIYYEAVPAEPPTFPASWIPFVNMP